MTYQSNDRLEYANGSYMHWCKGCLVPHIIPLGNPYSTQWTFNGDIEKATFTPSVRHQWGNGRCCHYNITDGMIHYHHDSTHSLAGKTLPLPPLHSQSPIE